MFFPRRRRPRRQHSASPRLVAASVRHIDALEDRTLLSSVSVVGGELRIDGANAETNNFTLDYDAGTDTYTVTDTNALTAGAGTVAVDAFTATIDGGLLDDRVRVHMLNSPTGTNTVDINANGGAGWGNEGLQVNDLPAANEVITVGAGGIDVQAGAARGDVNLLGDTVFVDGSITTADGNIALNRNNQTGVTTISSADLIAGGGEELDFNGDVVLTGGTVFGSGVNVFFDRSVSGSGSLEIISDNNLTAAGDVDADLAHFTAANIIDVDGTISGGTLIFNTPDLNLDDVGTIGELTMQVGDFEIDGTIAAGGFAVATLQSRVAGNAIEIHNVAAVPDDPDSGIFALEDLDHFNAANGFQFLRIGGPQQLADGFFTGALTSEVTLVPDGTPSTLLAFPVETAIAAGTIHIDEGLSLLTDDGADRISLFGETINQNNPFRFKGGNELTIFSLNLIDPTLTGDVTVNGPLQAAALTTGGPTASLTVGVDGTFTANGKVTEFTDTVIGADVANFTDTTAVTSRGDLRVSGFAGPGLVTSIGGFTADGDVMIDGDLEQTGRNLLLTRGGGTIEVTGDVIGNGFDLLARGQKAKGANPAVNAAQINFLGEIDGVGRFDVVRTDGLLLGGDVSAMAASGSDVSLLIDGLLEIGGDITGLNRVDITATGGIDLIGDEDHIIDSVNDVRISLNGDLLDDGTLTLDIAGGQLTRNGLDGAVTVVIV